MKHEHSVEVTLSPPLRKTVNEANDYIQENKKAFLFGLSGVVIGFALSRPFSRPSISIEIFTGKDLLS